MSEPLANPAKDGKEGLPWKLIGLAVVVIAIAIFFFQNRNDVPVDFLWIDVTWPLWAVIGISVAAGVALSRLGTWQWRRARRRRDEAR